MDDMALLVGETSRIEGNQSEMLHVIFGALVDTLNTMTSMSKLDADTVAMQQLVRLQSRLAGHGYVIRDV